ncbi:MAG: hypothetical protein FalmKO_16460 [Falsiruegeria mediterranea]
MVQWGELYRAQDVGSKTDLPNGAVGGGKQNEDDKTLQLRNGFSDLSPFKLTLICGTNVSKLGCFGTAFWELGRVTCHIP